MERTELSQPDEALRQTRTDAAVRAGLTWIADRLTDQRPRHDMLPAARLALALRVGLDVHGYTDEAHALERDLLARMPHIEQEISRGEYALILRRAAGSAV
ncbi:hypothetical protein Q5762_07370 [Streptomyces sp. P9(2023)]|uniref:hypothetical protein n=1 Tax=Streptomyces sp. P9(2023) TaxID=3064394 RepID=UPI0028F44F9D|nr:hypothetical protein [Streptomyces sp. P9(2023)]MDT9688176.1 hypothetical protein [Streptomyces sp. P9(2023)]